MHHRFIPVALLTLLCGLPVANAQMNIDWEGTYALTSTYQAGPTEVCTAGSATLLMADTFEGELIATDHHRQTLECTQTEWDVVVCRSYTEHDGMIEDFAMSLRTNNEAVAGHAVVHVVTMDSGVSLTCKLGVSGERVE